MWEPVLVCYSKVGTHPRTEFLRPWYKAHKAQLDFLVDQVGITDDVIQIRCTFITIRFIIHFGYGV